MVRYGRVALWGLLMIGIAFYAAAMAMPGKRPPMAAPENVYDRPVPGRSAGPS